MPSGNIAIIRRVYEAFSKGDLETLAGLTTPDFVLRASSATDGAEHHGPRAMEEILTAIDERWEDFRLEPLEFYDGGHCVLVLCTLVAKGRGGKEGLASVAGHVWTLRDGKIVSMEAYLDSEQAIRAAGLTRLLV